MDMKKLDIKRLLREERNKRGLTYDQVARRVGCSTSYLFRVEKGARKVPSENVMRNIIDYFELSEEELMNYNRDISDVDYNTGSLLESANSVDVNNLKDVVRFLQVVAEYQENKDSR
ncbi:helix-turn-helix domain-containing protein [Saliterribacillus persicus]|uniref:Transcriptional regulator with XRE-family HTH domain n=1 Tax=Saliterribacillus persicus TaxID=930114 RepID=A0A368X4Y6_9BACI|nr:helix-turn-helix transcriptional regulator [Saliterribacillus persicus]RCW62875.1 transcriptional regulator with XRE-family HTH domain [Saliterribacillus persicus]